jgi:hypothetical protein
MYINQKLFKEALVVGLGVSIIGTLISYLAMAYSNNSFNFKFDHWFSVIISEFLTGFLIHYLSEYYGLNKWYCKNGNACN